MLTGYARVSTGEQTLDPQLSALREAGCITILEEHASGAASTCPALGRLLAAIRPGTRWSWSGSTGWRARFPTSYK